MSSLIDLPSAYLFSRVFAFRPVVRKAGNQLVASSDWRSQLFSLGFSGRRVVLDPAQKTIRLIIRRFWFWRTSRRIEFDWVQEVLYGYSDLSLGWSARQQQDLFTVGLRLKNGEELTLFRFFGEGDFVNEGIWPDWMYWQDAIVAEYTRGSQESESLLFADLVARMIGVPVSNPQD